MSKYETNEHLAHVATQAMYSLRDYATSRASERREMQLHFQEVETDD